MRGADVAAVKAHIAITQIIGQNDYDVGAGRGGGERAPDRPAEDEETAGF